MWKKLVVACACGLAGYAFPRLLIELGLPLDTYISDVAKKMSTSLDWVTPEVVFWGIVIIVAVSLFGLESKWHPAVILWQSAFKKKPTENIQSETANNDIRRTRAQRISDLYSEAIAVRNRAFSLRVLDNATHTRMTETRRLLVEEMRDLAPERSVNLETINTYDQQDHPTCLLQEPSRTQAMVFSEVLLRTKRILEDYQ